MGSEMCIRDRGTIDLNDLKSLDENALLQASRNLYHPYRPIIDGKIITDNLAKKYIEGSINDVDLMIGSNKNEDLLYVEENPTLDSFTKRIADYYPEQVDEILGLLYTTDLRLAMDHFGSNQQTTCPSVLIAWQSGLRDMLFCLLYTSPSPRDLSTSRMPSSA